MKRIEIERALAYKRAEDHGKRCPFCGGDDIRLIYQPSPVNDTYWARVYCGTCDAGTGSARLPWTPARGGYFASDDPREQAQELEFEKRMWALWDMRDGKLCSYDPRRKGGAGE